MAYFRLREIAKPLRWSARSLAIQSGLSYNTVWTMWVNRSAGCDLSTLQRIADTIGCAPGDLIGSGDPAPDAEPDPDPDRA